MGLDFMDIELSLERELRIGPLHPPKGRRLEVEHRIRARQPPDIAAADLVDLAMACVAADVERCAACRDNPRGCDTCREAGRFRGGREEAWRLVRGCVAEALAMRPESVFPESLLKRDLGAR